MIFRLALRNIWRNKRRSLLTMSAMVVSSSLLILSLGVFTGMIFDVLASATEQYHGHIVVSKTGYQDDRDLFALITNPKEVTALLDNNVSVIARSARLRAFGLLSHADETKPVEILGIVPEDEAMVTTLASQIRSGTFVEGQDGAVLGDRLAKRLGVTIGDELVFLTQAADGSIGNDLLYVSGIFTTGDPSTDSRLVLAPRRWLQQLLALNVDGGEGGSESIGAAHEIAVRIIDPLQAGEVAAEISDNISTNISAKLIDDIEVLDWGILLPEMREVVASFDVSSLIMVGILYMATGLGIINTFFMSVMERTREFGVMMAIGMRPWRLRLLILLESFLMGIFSLIAGALIGTLLTIYMHHIGIDLSDYITPITYAGGSIPPRLSATIELKNILLPSVLLLLVSVCAGFLPANRAARLDPVVAIREE